MRNKKILFLGATTAMAMLATVAVLSVMSAPPAQARCPGQIGCTLSQSTRSYTYTSLSSCEIAEDVVYLATLGYFQAKADRKCGTFKKACNVEFVVEGWCQEIDLGGGQTGYRVTGHHEFGCKTCLPGIPHEQESENNE